MPDEPTAMDLLDPAPAPPEPDPPAEPPKPKRHVPGPIERKVRAELRNFPAEHRDGAIAAVAVRLAMEMDAGVVLGRDAAGHGREIRMCMVQLREWAPGGDAETGTDEVRRKREERLSRNNAVPG